MAFEATLEEADSVLGVAGYAESVRRRRWRGRTPRGLTCRRSRSKEGGSGENGAEVVPGHANGVEKLAETRSERFGAADSLFCIQSKRLTTTLHPASPDVLDGGEEKARGVIVRFLGFVDVAIGRGFSDLG